MSPSAECPGDEPTAQESKTPASITQSKHDSKVSLATKTSIRSARGHQEYLDSLVPPTQEVLERISTVQERKEEEGMMKRLSEDGAGLTDEERARAAGIIQKNYRGHRERRILDGVSLDPGTRWLEAVKEARYRNLIQPRAKVAADSTMAGTEIGGMNSHNGPDGTSHASLARYNWKKIGLIAKRAGGDEDSESSGSECEEITADEREKRREQRAERKRERQKAAKIMDLQYFLEMVDLKHRYGSNLRAYHGEWKKSDTKENFFFWLDHGEGRFIDCQGCPRERLDREQVRYLSKEERLHYLVKIDEEGRLCWAKNGAYIDTTVKFKDSIHGIVPDTDETPAYMPPTAEVNTEDEENSSEL